MNRFLVVAVGSLIVASVGRADLLPPGTKNIAVEHTIETDNNYPDWVFFIVHGSGSVQQVTLDTKTPIVIPGSSAVGNGPIPQPGAKDRIPYRSAALVAIPKDAVKKYASEKELHAAIEDGKVEGMVRARDYFFDHENAKTTDPRTSIAKRYRVKAFNTVMPREGIELEEIVVPSSDQPTEKTEMSSSPTIFRWVAIGLATAAAIGFTGLFLIARSRRAREMGT